MKHLRVLLRHRQHRAASRNYFIVDERSDVNCDHHRDLRLLVSCTLGILAPSHTIALALSHSV